MSGPPRTTIFNLSVTPAGGSGTAMFTMTGELFQVSIIPPTNATYGFDIAEGSVDGHGVAGQSGLSGRFVKDINQVVHGDVAFSIINSSTDAAYAVRLRAMRES